MVDMGGEGRRRKDAVSLVGSLSRLEFHTHQAVVRPAEVEIGIQVAFAADADEDAVFKLEFVLALDPARPPQFEEVVDVVLLRVLVTLDGAGGLVLVVKFFDFLDFLEANGLGVHGHLAQFLGFGTGLLPINYAD